MNPSRGDWIIMNGDLAAAFARDGYIVIENLFSSDEVSAFKEECKRILENAAHADIANHGVFVGLSANSGVFRKAASDPRVVRVLKQIIGDRIVFLSDKVVFKSAETKFGSPWHQDWPYWEGSHKISVWIALDPAVKENGCLKVIPGSHLWGVLTHSGDASDGHGFVNRMRPEHIDESKSVSLSVSAGTAVFFHDLLLHASHPNSTGEDRWALITTYKDGNAADPEYDWAVAAFTITD